MVLISLLDVYDKILWPIIEGRSDAISKEEERFNMPIVTPIRNQGRYRQVNLIEDWFDIIEANFYYTTIKDTPYQ